MMRRIPSSNFTSWKLINKPTLNSNSRRWDSVCDAIDDQSNRQGKSKQKRIVSMLTRLIQRTHTVAEDAFEYEYRDAEYEYEEQPEKRNSQNHDRDRGPVARAPSHTT